MITIDVDHAFRAFKVNPKARISLGKNVCLTASFKRFRCGPITDHYVVTRLVDKRSGRWFLASASPFTYSRSFNASLGHSLSGLVDELVRIERTR